MWAQGALTYELLTGLLPVGHIDASEEMQWAERTVAVMEELLFVRGKCVPPLRPSTCSLRNEA